MVDINIRTGFGSGIVWDRDGHVMTNHHVISSIRHPERATSRGISVKLPNGKTYSATHVASGVRRDIAMLKVDAPRRELHPVQQVVHLDLSAGATVCAMGNPYGGRPKFRKGRIEDIEGRVMVTFAAPDGVYGEIHSGLVKHSARTKPGMSGGPVVDADGDLVGMTTSGNASSFAIAVEDMMEFADAAIGNGDGYAIPVEDLIIFFETMIENGSYAIHVEELMKFIDALERHYKDYVQHSVLTAVFGAHDMYKIHEAARRDQLGINVRSSKGWYALTSRAPCLITANLTDSVRHTSVTVRLDQPELLPPLPQHVQKHSRRKIQITH